MKKKTAVIAGGAGVIGVATARLFIEEGARVLLADINEAGLIDAVNMFDNALVSHAICDMSDPQGVESLVQKAMERFGGIDIFVNNVSIEGEVNSIVDYSIDVFDRVMSVNVRGSWLGLKYVIPEMAKRGGGSIILSSSVAGIKGSPKVSAYVASKHAIIGIMRSAALECAPLNIRVNVVNPAPIESRMMGGLEKGLVPSEPEKARKALLARIPLGRYGTPDEVAQLILFLASDESQFCTGGVYMVDGGVSAQ